ncbi:hypothetical protein PS3A_40920 [Pseudomonas sp. 3A(2025)]
MDIISYSPGLVISHWLPKLVTPDAENTSPNLQHAAEDRGDARSKAFYTREAEPWKGKTYIYSDFGKPEEVRPMTKAMYLEELKRDLDSELTVQQSIYSKIRNELGVFRPDLASKNFSYTLGDDKQVKILNQDSSLTEDDLEYLTKRFNDHSRFRDSVNQHAKMAMALVDHDDETFGGKYKLDLLNIQNTLDYGKLIMLKPENMHEAFIRQIIENGERREQPLVDITV